MLPLIARESRFMPHTCETRSATAVAYAAPAPARVLRYAAARRRACVMRGGVRASARVMRGAMPCAHATARSTRMRQRMPLDMRC